MSYKPRNEFVLLRLGHRDKTVAGVVLPEVSDEGKVWTVVAVGPKVDDLLPGDVVHPMGTMGQDIARLPREADLFITAQANILLVGKKKVH